MRKAEIADKLAAPRHERRVLKSRDRPADNPGGGGFAAAAHGRLSRSSANAARTASTMFSIAGAAAQIRRQRIEQRVVGDVGLAFENAGGQHQETGRAEPALQGVMFDEGALQRVQDTALRQPLDGADRAALGLHREDQAGAHRIAVEQYRARAADAVLATHMRAGQPAIVADRIEQGAARLHAQSVALGHSP